MLSVVGNHIRHRKSIVIGKKINHSVGRRILPEIIGETADTALIPFQVAPHHLLISLIMFPEAPAARYTSAIYAGSVKSYKDQLRLFQKIVFHDLLHLCPFTDQMETVHAKRKLPVMKDIQDKIGRQLRSEIKLQDTFNARFMECIHKFRKFLHWAIRRGVRFLGGKIQRPGSVSPIIDSFLMFHITQNSILIRNPEHFRLRSLKELIDRHQLQSIDPQFFQIRDFLDDAPEGSLRPDFRTGVPGKSAHMRLIQHHLFIRQLQRPCLHHRSLRYHRCDTVGVFRHLLAEFFPSVQFSRIDILLNFPVDPVIIRECLGSKALYQYAADISDPVFFPQRDLLPDVLPPFFI